MKKITYLFFTCLLLFADLALAQTSVNLNRPKAGAKYQPGYQVFIDWNPTENVRKYELRLFLTGSDNGTPVVEKEIFYKHFDCWNDFTQEMECTCSPKDFYYYTIPCGLSGKVRIEIKQFHREPFDCDEYDQIFPTYVGGFIIADPLVRIPVIPPVLKCSPGVEKIIIPNPDNANMLLLYASAGAAAVGAAYDTLFPVPLSGRFEYIDTFSTSHAFYAQMKRTNPKCPSIELFSAIVPVAVMVMPAEVYTFVTESREIVDIPYDPLNPVTFTDLDGTVNILDSLINIAYATANQLFGDAASVTPVSVKAKWIATPKDSITLFPTATGYINRVAAHNLPKGPGECRKYTLELNVNTHIILYNTNGSVFLDKPVGCKLGKLREVTVAKKIIPPDPDIILICKEGTQGATMPNTYGHTGMEWYTTPVGTPPVNKYLPPIPNPHYSTFIAFYNQIVNNLNQNTNNGFTYTQDYQFKNNHTYLYWVCHVQYTKECGIRRSERVPVKIIVLPQPNLSTDSADVRKPEVNNCDELGTYKTLGTSIDLDYKQSVEATILTNPLPGAAVQTFYSEKWVSPGCDTCIVYKDVFDTLTQASVKEARACWEKLPNYGGSYRDYYKVTDVTFSVKKLNPVIAADTIPKLKKCSVESSFQRVKRMIEAPEPKVFILCNTGVQTVTMPNPDNYANMRWYSSPIGGQPISDYKSDANQNADEDGNGFTFRRLYTPGNEADYATVYYVTHVTANGKESALPRTKVAIVAIGILPKAENEVYINEPPEEEVTGIDECDFPGTYHDLNQDVSQFTTHVQNIVDYINQNQNLITANYGHNQDWVPDDSITFYTSDITTQTTERVCYSNLGTNDKQLYTLWLSNDITITLFDDPSQNLAITQHFEPCRIIARRTMVRKSPDLTNTGDSLQTCAPDFNNPTMPFGYTDCQEMEEVTACPDNSYIIGPLYNPDEWLNTISTTYQWNPNTGLKHPVTGANGANMKNPSVAWNDIPTFPGQFFKYTLKMTTTTATSPPETVIKTFCTAIYKCPSCTGNSRVTGYPQTEDKPLTADTELMHLHPNPATTTLHVAYKAEEPGTIAIYNMVGQLMYSRNFAGQESINIDASSFKAGLYLCKIATESGKAEQQTISIIR